jgi:hypothetical protein
MKSIMVKGQEFNNKLVNGGVDVSISDDLLVDQEKRFKRMNTDKGGETI